MDADTLLAVAGAAVDAVAATLADLGDWSLAGTRDGQYRSDLAADAAAVEVLIAGGLAVLSEESGLHKRDRPLLAVLDPLDGSTNGARRIPWYASSICVLDERGPLAALVVNLATRTRYEALRGGGARRDGRVIRPSGTDRLSRALVGISGYPARHLGWRQFRALGAVALDLCGVADGTLDAFVDCVDAPHGGPWDYLGGLLVCQEAGAFVADAVGDELVVRDPREWRRPVAGASTALLDELLAARAAASGVTSR